MTDGNLKKYQKEIDAWFKEASWEYWSPHEILASLVEEVGEFARLINRMFGRKKKKATDLDKELEGEIGDILFSIMCFANSNNIDLDKVMEENIAKAKARDKERFKVSK